MRDPVLENKLSALRKFFRLYGSAAIAFSGGVDSTFLLKVAHDELGEKVLAVSAVSILSPKRETEAAAAFCKEDGIRLVTIQIDPLKIPRFKNNPENRCYICKKKYSVKSEVWLWKTEFTQSATEAMPTTLATTARE